MQKDLSFYDEETNTVLNVRVSAIIIKDNKILLQKVENGKYYFLVGGRVQLGESSLVAIKREVLEETGVRVEDEECQLLDTVENFFTDNGRNYHEILFLYKVNNEELLNKGEFKTLDKDDSYNYWIDIKELNKLDIRPDFIKKMI